MAEYGTRSDPHFPGREKLPLPPVPGDQDSRSMFTAHRVDGMLNSLAHAHERMLAARKTPALRGYHAIHIANHLAETLKDGHALAENLRRNYPAEARELEAVKQAVGLARALSPDIKAATTAHLLETVLHEATHGKRHADLMLKPEPPEQWEFNADHAAKHLDGCAEHAAKLAQHLKDNYPAEGRWLRMLQERSSGGVAGKKSHARYVKASSSSGPSKTKAQANYRESASQARRCGTCSMYEDGRCTLVKGSIDPGHVCDFWEKDKAAGKVSLAISSPVPGRQGQYGLHQVPSQTVSPSPPLPPEVKVPTAAEVRALKAKVPDGIDVTLSNSARTFLETAAVKLEKNDEIGALAALRGVQSSLYSAAKKDAGAGRPAVYGPAAVPPAEQSSAGASMLKAYQDQLHAWRALSVAVAALIDRLRKRFFRGKINGYLPNMRLAGDEADLLRGIAEGRL